MTGFPALIDKLQRRVDLSVDEAASAMETIMDGQAPPSQIAGLLVGFYHFSTPAAKLRASTVLITRPSTVSGAIFR